MIEQPNGETCEIKKEPPRIPHLEVAAYGDQETFLTMLELLLNSVIDVTNMLVAKEIEREEREGKHRIILPGQG